MADLAIEQMFLEKAKICLNLPLVCNKVTSRETNVVYELINEKQRWFLKMGQKVKEESNKLNWLKSYLPVPEVVAFFEIEGKEALLQTAIPGQNLVALSKIWSKEMVVEKLAKALQKFHAAERANCPFSEWQEGKVLVHGDACLPNILFDISGNLTGFVDLGDCKLGFPEVDLSAAIWSLQFNLGKGYGLDFLQAYGIKDPTEDLVEELRLKY